MPRGGGGGGGGGTGGFGDMAMADSGSFEDELKRGSDLTDGWYENDLHLAAELGKTLLERNKELDENLLASQQENEEQAMQIVYLEKQLQILRDVTDSKAHVYEQLDLNAQETEKNNQKLQHELRTAQQKILGMSETIEYLEMKSQEQQAHIQQLKTSELERLREGRRQKRILEALGANSSGAYPLRRARSHDFGVAASETLREEEVAGLHRSLRSLQEKLAGREQRVQDAEAELTVLLRENRRLEERAKELEVQGQMRAIRRDYKSLATSNEAVCKYCDSLIHADFEALAAGGRGGCPAAVAASPTDPGGEEGLMSAERLSQLVGHPKPEGVSLLGEIDAQYHALMGKYNSLLARSRCGSLREECARPRALSLRRKAETGHQTGDKAAATTPAKSVQASPMESMFENGPPEYRKLFNEIFEILHRPHYAHQQDAAAADD